MHHFVAEMCTHVNIIVTKWCTAEYDTGAYYGICVTGLLGEHSCDVAPWTVVTSNKSGSPPM